MVQLFTIPRFIGLEKPNDGNIQELSNRPTCTQTGNDVVHVVGGAILKRKAVLQSTRGEKKTNKPKTETERNQETNEPNK